MWWDKRRGILATSELQAVAMGAPTEMSVRPGYYPGSPFPVEADAEGITQRVREVLEDPISASTSSNGASWVRRHYGPETLVPELAAIYRAAAKH